MKTVQQEIQSLLREKESIPADIAKAQVKKALKGDNPAIERIDRATQKKHKLKLSNATEIQRSLTTVANLVINGEIGCKEANAFGYLANQILASIRTDDMQRMIEELQETVEELKK